MKKFRLPLGRKRILKIISHADFLTNVYKLEEGKWGAGVAVFPKDPAHFEDGPIVKASWIEQACYEIGELVVRSLPDTIKKRFKCMTSGKNKFRKPVPQGIPLHLRADVKINSDHTRGKAQIGGWNPKTKELSVNVVFTFQLKEIPAGKNLS